jgi:hypothetical protein
MVQQVRLAEGRAAAAEEARQRQQEEAAFLRRGIDLAAEQLTKSAGADVPAALLTSLARVRALWERPADSSLLWPASNTRFQIRHGWCRSLGTAFLLQAQEEAMAMSVQLADSQQQVAQMASALQHARTHLLEQQKVGSLAC